MPCAQERDKTPASPCTSSLAPSDPHSSLLQAGENWTLPSIVQLAASCPAAQFSPAHTPNLCEKPDSTAFLNYFSSFLYASIDPFPMQGELTALPLRFWFACLLMLSGKSTNPAACSPVGPQSHSHTRDPL